jgi:4-amino-4-deoxy-L-arabinose transferase-like glycosyltransferase
MYLRSTKSWINLVVLACIIHAMVLFVAMPYFSKRLANSYTQESYADGYDEIATNLANGRGYRFFPDTAKTLMREPGYPLFLAGILLALGNELAGVKLANMLLALSTALLVAMIARKFSSNRTLILSSPLLFLLHPGVLIAESRGGVEILFTFFLVLYVFVLYQALENNSPWRYVISGGVLGLTVLVKSTPMLFPFFLLAYLIVFDRRGNSIPIICRNVALMVFAMIVTLSPWIIRNYTLTEKFIPTASVLGVSAHSGQYLCTHLSANNLRKDVDREGARERRRLALELGLPFKDIKDAYYQYFYSTDDELKFSNFLFARVKSEYEKSPALFVRCACMNLFDFWFAGKTGESTRMNLVIQIPYLLLGIVGIVLSVRIGQWELAAPLVLLILYAIAIYAPILAQARYSVPVIPFLSILAAVTLMAAQKKAGELLNQN